MIWPFRRKKKIAPKGAVEVKKWSELPFYSLDQLEGVEQIDISEENAGLDPKELLEFEE